MSLATIASIVLTLLKIINIITSGIDHERWRQLGYDQAIQSSLDGIKKNLGIADEAHKDADKKTDTQLDDVLKS